MNILFNWLKNKFRKESDEDIEKEIDELLKKIKEIDPIITNPYNQEYHKKSNELFQSILTARDNFINWITGLSTGAIFFVFTKVSSEIGNVSCLKLAGRTLFATIICALFFKFFLEVRYGILRFDVYILGTLWEGGQLKQEVKKMLDKQGEVDKETKREFLENHREHLRLLDSKYLERFKRQGSRQIRALTLFYYLSLLTFVSGIILLATAYL